MDYIKISILLFSIGVFSQNLVLNPSFENSKCKSFISNFDVFVSNWSTPTYGSTDLFSSCIKGMVSNPVNYNGIQIPKSGKNYAGFYLFSKDNYREYVQGELSQKLKKGEKYIISFYISLAENSDYAIRDVGVLLTEQKLKIKIHRELSERQLKKHKISGYSLYEIDNSRYYTDKKEWTFVQIEFIAKGNEKFFTIGNFDRNSKTKKQLVVDKDQFNMSYYYIDSISLVKKDSIKTNNVKNSDSIVKHLSNPVLGKIKLNKDYIFKNVVFDFNSFRLSNAAKSEINTVFQFLKQNNNLNVIIYGHTDNVGNSDFNQTLSEKRAKAIAEYFISLGLLKERITSYGYGESRPIESNDTEIGRNKNRRVEFRIVKNN